MLAHAQSAGASGICQRLCSNSGHSQRRSSTCARLLGAGPPGWYAAAEARSIRRGEAGGGAVPVASGGVGSQRPRLLLAPHSRRLSFRGIPLLRAAQGAHGPEEPSANTPPAHQDSSAGSPPAAAPGGSSAAGAGAAPGPAGGVGAGAAAPGSGAESTLMGEFCIIEGPNTLQDFARMQLEEIRDNIDSRRNRIFLLMEEIRRLRIQQRLRRREQKARATATALAASGGVMEEEEEEEELPEYPSFIPFLPPLTSSTLREYYATFAGLVFCIIIFGAIVAPTLEVRLGLGGTSYADFIRSVGLPMQLSEVDPIVASFSGGAVGVLSALLVVETNNVKLQEHKKCMYCYGSGYLTCARCSGTGAVMATESVGTSAGAGVQPAEMRCPNCAGSSKVMCPTCLCTGRALATEHDPRIDPFD